MARWRSPVVILSILSLGGCGTARAAAGGGSPDCFAAAEAWTLERRGGTPDGVAEHQAFNVEMRRLATLCSVSRR